MCNQKVVLAIGLISVITQSCLGAEIDDHPNWQYLPKTECGIGAMADRIIGGKEASLGQFPWMVRLAYQMKTGKNKLYYLCGGSIINKWYVITANHCFLDSMADNIRQVRVGENFLKEEPDCEHDVCAPPVQDIDVAEVIRFDEYKEEPSITYGDIALLKLAAPIEFNDFVAPICLPGGVVADQIDNYMSPGTSVEVAGWGTTTAELNRIPDKLMYVQMPVVDLDKCKQSFPKNTIDESMICVGIGEGKDSCVGDSGGPLMKPIVLDAPPRYFLFGIVSYGMRWCGIAGAVYTNVTHYVKWVLDKMEPLE